jgi:hypothetical protein
VIENGFNVSCDGMLGTSVFANGAAANKSVSQQHALRATALRLAARH